MGKQAIPPVDPEGIGPIKQPDSGPKTTPDRSQFDSLMQEPAKSPSSTPSSAQISPLELPQGAITGAQPASLDSLIAQVWQSENKFDDLQRDLNTKNLRFRRSEQYLMRNKLSEANTHLTAASEKMGAKVLPDQTLSSGLNPVEKFLKMVTHGQSQLTEAKQTLTELKDTEEGLSPADLMLVQVKLAQAQQELEYASILLSKVIDVIKQMINIQL